MYNEAGQLVISLQRLPLLGLRIPGAAGPGCQRQCGGHPAHQARERGLGCGTSRWSSRRSRASTCPWGKAMRALRSSQLIGLWERGQDLDSTERALTLLAAACPGKTRGELATYSLGRRDACLLELQELTFPGDLDAFAECPRCATPLEYTLPVADLRTRTGPPADTSPILEIEGFSLELRPIDSTDLASVRRCRSVEEARRTLARRCVIGGSGPDELHDAALAAVAARLAEADPGADLRIDLRCPSCGESWQVVFDIATYLWAEIQAMAKRLLHEVHALARAYGWRERRHPGDERRASAHLSRDDGLSDGGFSHASGGEGLGGRAVVQPVIPSRFAPRRSARGIRGGRADGEPLRTRTIDDAARDPPGPGGPRIFERGAVRIGARIPRQSHSKRRS